MRDFEFHAGAAGAPEDVLHVASDAPIDIPGRAIFAAEYQREGHDLVIETAGQPDLRLVDYFRADAPPDLIADNGAVLRGDLAARLAGPIAPGQYAQAGGPDGADPIGQVETLQGVAFAERVDGTRVQLDIGAKIYENDVLITDGGGKMSVTFADGTIFTLAANSRMVIDDLVYDPDASEGNGGAFSLVEGGFVFIAGEVAKTGGMDVNTPTATMGIRGTTVLVEITTLDGVSTVEVSLNTDPDGGTGMIELRDLSGNLIATIDSTDTKWIVSPVEGETREVVRTADDLADDQALLLDAARAYALAFERVEAGGTFVELSSSSGGSEPDRVDTETGTQGNDSDPDDGTPPSGDGSGGGTGGSGGGTTGAPLNTLPEAGDDEATGPEDGTITGNVLANDSDADADPVSVIVNSLPQNGTLDLDNASGAYTYTPDADFSGTDGFTYTVTDGKGGTDTASVTLTVTSVQDAPVATDDEITVAEDSGPLSFNVLDNDSDADTGDTLSLTAPVTDGFVTIAQDGTVSGTPPADYTGTQVISYTVTDGNGNSDTADLTVTVTSVQDAPVATDDEITVAEDSGALSFNVLDNDSDADTGDTLSLAAPVTDGFVTIAQDGTVSGTPPADYTGTQVISYTVTDGNGNTDTADLTVTVTSVQDAPVATDDEITVAEDSGPLTFNVLDNDSDADTGDTLSLAAPVTDGFVTIAQDGTVSGTPPADYTGTQVISYTVTDGNGNTDTADLTVTVTSVQDAPVATDDEITAAEDSGTLSFNVLDNDSDADTGDTLTLAAPVTDGFVTIAQDGTVSGTPPADYTGTQVISYTVTDGNGNSDTADLTVTVTSVQDAPVATDDEITVAEDSGALSFNVLDNDSDADTGDTLSLAAPVTDGFVTIAQDGTVSGTPPADYTGAQVISYTVTDGAGATDTGSVDVSVAAVNDAPVADDATIEADAGEVFAGTATASDVEGDDLTFSMGTGPAHGTVTVHGDGSYTYEADAGFFGLDSFEVVVSDGTATDTATVTVAVEPGEVSYSDEDTGQTVTLDIAADAEGGNPAGNVAVGVNNVESNVINISFALDGSGSIGSQDFTTMQNAVHAAVQDLAEAFEGSETTVNIQILHYDSGIEADSNTESNAADFTLANAESVVLPYITNLNYTGGGTSWGPPLDRANDFFNPSDADTTNLLYFITDGSPGDNWDSSRDSLESATPNLEIETFWIGATSATSQLIDLDSDGNSTQVTSASSLYDAFSASPLFAAQLVDFSLTLDADDTDHGEIADEDSPALVSDGLNYDLALADIDGIGDLLGEDNLFTATATFDLDGDTDTTDDQVTINSVELISKNADAQDVAGTAKSDLLLGSDLADDISGGDGNDVILGFGGDDVLSGGAGDDFIHAGDGDDTLIEDLGADSYDGGAGRDLLAFATGIHADGDLIATLAGSDIEAVDLSNGEADALSISHDDVIALSTTADTDLETLLDAALAESATILGETGDSVTLEAGASGDWVLDQAGVADGNGNTLDIYQYVDGGTVLATLGIDDEVTVQPAIA
jgi:hypothetical protein